MNRRLPIIVLFALVLVGMWAGVAFGQDAAPSPQQPSISLSLDTGEGGYVAALKILLLVLCHIGLISSIDPVETDRLEEAEVIQFLLVLVSVVLPAHTLATAHCL